MMTSEKPHRVVICAYHGLSMLEYGAAVEIYISHGRTNQPWYQGQVVSCDGPELQLGDGSRLLVADDLDVLLQANTIILPGWRDINERPPRRYWTPYSRRHKMAPGWSVFVPVL